MNLENLPVEIPAPAVLREIREELGLSQSELAGALGFSPIKGPQNVRDWEHGRRDGKPYAPSGSAWAAFRYLVMLTVLYRSDDAEEDRRHKLRRLLPACIA